MTPTSLVIVESPSKAKVIGGYLGKSFVVKSCVGHVRDIVSGDEKDIKGLDKEEYAKFKRLGISPSKDWFTNYQIIAGKEKIVRELRSLAKKSKNVYLASDQDREGEAIAWHLQELLKDCNSSFKRVAFNEVTKPAILEAFKNPKGIDLSLVDAQKARRILDRVFGFELSPVLWQKVARNLSAGRVQSPALRLLVAKELEILGFDTKEFWNMSAYSHLQAFESSEHSKTKLELTNKKENQRRHEDSNDAESSDAKDDISDGKDEYLLKVVLDRKLLTIENQEQAEAVLAKCKKAGTIKIESVTKKLSQISPQPPFITSTLQRAAGTYLRYGLTQTMMFAQKLYENGYITYMRTDSVNISSLAQIQAKKYIDQTFGEEYSPSKFNFYKTKQATAQEVHEAIRPTDVFVDSKRIDREIGPEAGRLYRMIWSRFVASQMTKAKLESITAKCKVAEYVGLAKGQCKLFDGFTKVWVYGKGADVLLPNLEEGAIYQLDLCHAKQNYTKPPARFTESSLVKELEDQEIGRPSTYASIITTLQDRNYVKKMANRKLSTTLLGNIVSDKLSASFDNFIDTGFTASMENDLDKVAKGDKDWKKLLDSFYSQLTEKISDAKANMPSIIAEPIKISNYSCSECDHPLAIRINKDGQFLGCSEYTACNARFKEKGGNKPFSTNLDDVLFNEELRDFMPSDEDKKCKKCGSVMLSMFSEAKRIQVCSSIEGCGNAVAYDINWKKPELVVVTFPCDTPKCKGELQSKTGRFGKYFSCETCNSTRKATRYDTPAPRTMVPIPITTLHCEKNKDDHYVLREGVKGLFLSASKYPKVREARSPSVDEVKQVVSKMEKRFFQMVDSAPSKDEEDRKLFFGKTKHGQYVAKPKEKAKAFYIWSEDQQTWRQNKSK